MNFEYESYLVKRKNNNPDNSFFLYRIKDRENNPGLSFSEKQIGATKELKNYPYRQVFRFLQECINTPNYYARLALLLAALEAMSGEVEKMSCDCPKGKCYKTYDKDKMKEILGDDNLFNDLFGPEGLRHKLLHGHLIDFELSKDYFSKIYKAIVRYFNKSYFLEIYEEMEGAKQYAKHLPRSFFGNKELLELWLRTTGEINLKNVLNIFSKDTYWIGHKEGDFEVIKEPPNY